MKWLHYTDTSEIILSTITYETRYIEKIKNSTEQFKPVGLWLSYNDEWLQWCKVSDYYNFNPNYYYVYEFDIKKDANLITIGNYVELLQFVEYYRYKSMMHGSGVNWNKVYEDYDGLVILNYDDIKDQIFKQDLNMNTLKNIDLNRSMLNVVWFLGLDCSCACIFKTYYLIEKSRKIKISNKQTEPLSSSYDDELTETIAAVLAEDKKELSSEVDHSSDEYSDHIVRSINSSIKSIDGSFKSFNESEIFYDEFSHKMD